MIELFDAAGLQKKAAIFDPKKLEWMNGQHLSRVPAAKLAPRVTPLLVAAGLATEGDLAQRQDWYLALLDLLKVRSRTTDDIVRQAAPFLRGPDIEYDPEAAAKQWKDPVETASILTDTAKRLATVRWEPAAMEEALRKLADERGVGGGKIFQPLRVALTGLAVSPGIFDVLVMLGRDLSLARIERAAKINMAR
jgi:glutamyl-tRNA synthetase